MVKYTVQRLLMTIPMLVGISILCFAVMHLAPGGPTQLMGDFDPRAKSTQTLAIQAGLDKPLYEQYFIWMGNVAQGDLGTSLMPDGRPVADKIAETLPLTLWLNGIGLILVFVLAIPLGVLLAARAGGAVDMAATLLLYLGLAAPSVWLALLSLQFFGVTLGWVPLSGLQSFGAENWGWWPRTLDLLHHLLLPVAVGLIGSLAGLVRFVRGNMVNVLAEPFILTARAKGASPWRVWGLHALRNAMLPVITILGLSIPGLIGGSVIIESLFALPGMGKLVFDATMMRDYPTIMALLMFGAILTLAGNLLADITYTLADPRTRPQS
jgi:peptide/nickel transport system permease protein